MGIGVREAIYICLECLVFAILILIVSLFGGYARESLHTKGNLNAQMTEIKEYRGIYEFTMGCEIKTSDIHDYMNQYGDNLKGEIINYEFKDIELFLYWNCDNYDDDEEDYFSIGKEWAFADTMVSGEDLVRFIGKYPNQYNIVILRTTESDIKYDKLRKEDSIEKWSMSYNMELLGESEIEEFYCFGIYDDLKNRYDCIVFAETEYIEYIREYYGI